MNRTEGKQVLTEDAAERSRRRVVWLIKKKIGWFLLDVFFICVGLFIAVEFYFSLQVSQPRMIQMGRTLPVLLMTTMISLWRSGIYKSLLRYASVDTLLQAGISTLVGTGLTYLISLAISLFSRGYEDQIGMRLVLMPRPVYFIQWVISLVLISGSRFLVRYRFQAKGVRGNKRILVIGAGYAGAVVIRDIQNGRYDGNAVAILDDDPSRLHSNLSRVPVVGGTDEIEETVSRLSIDEIIIAIATPHGEINELIKAAVNTGVHVLIYTGLHEEVREPQITDLLGRQEIRLATDGDYFRGKVVLITGGGGSIGSELARQVLAFNPKQLIIYDINENYMYDLLFELKEKYGELVSNTVILEVGSVRDEESLLRVMKRYRPQIVIHAAAHKHVPLMELSAEQAILNNVFGTYKTARAADACGVSRFVMISTDKAVNPTNVMGASKRLAEIILSSMPKKQMETVAVRFGNVLGSHGSVVPIFERQIKAGGPVTITDPEIIRYFMTIPEAASLVLQAASIAKGGELFILDMGEPVRIRNLAETMIRLSGREGIKIVYTGLRPGEKLYEELLLDKENDKATERDRIYIAKQERFEWSTVEQWLHRLEESMEKKEDVKETLKEILPTYKPSEQRQ